MVDFGVATGLLARWGMGEFWTYAILGAPLFKTLLINNHFKRAIL